MWPWEISRQNTCDSILHWFFRICVCSPPQVDAGAQAVAPPFWKTRWFKCLLACAIGLLTFLITGGAMLAWFLLGEYFFMSSLFSTYLFLIHTWDMSVWTAVIYSPSSPTDFRVWFVEPRVPQQYAAYMSILNRNFSADLSSHSSPLFWKEARGVETMVSRDCEFLWCWCKLE